MNVYPFPCMIAALRLLALTTTAWLLPLLPAQGPRDQQTTSGTLTVIIDGLESDRGSIRIALSNSEDNYYDYPNPTIGASAHIRRGIAEYEFRGLPYGDYAIKAFHDENANGELDTNFLGIPVEDYGFSNNASGLFGPPGWEHASFRIESDTLTVRISFD